MKRPTTGKYTFDECVEMASAFHSYSELFQGKRSLYTYTYRRGWLDTIAKQLGWPDKRASKYTFDVCRKIASSCHNRNDMFHKCAQAYEISKANGWDEQFAIEFRWTNYKIYTYEKCREIASKAKSRIDFSRINASAYGVSCEQKWLDKFAEEFNWKTKRELAQEKTDEHRKNGFIRKGGATFRTVDDVLAVAHTYSTYEEFRKKERKLYEYMCKQRKLHLLDFLPRSYGVIDGTVADTVYVYEFPDTGYAYVGRTIHLSRRDREHRTKNNDPVLKYAISNGLEVPPVKILCSNIGFMDGAELECRMISLYRGLGWLMLNKHKGGSLGSMIIKKWTLNRLIREAKQFKYWTDFDHAFPGAFTKIRKLHLRHLFPWLKYKTNRWDDVTFEDAKRYASEFTSSNAFTNKYRRLAEICLANGWMDLLFPSKHHLSLASRKKLSRAVNQYALDGTFICSHESMLVAAQTVGGCRTCISQVCRGGRPTAYGFIWKYADAA